MAAPGLTVIEGPLMFTTDPPVVEEALALARYGTDSWG